MFLLESFTMIVALIATHFCELLLLALLNRKFKIEIVTFSVISFVLAITSCLIFKGIAEYGYTALIQDEGPVQFPVVAAVFLTVIGLTVAFVIIRVNLWEKLGSWEDVSFKYLIVSSLFHALFLSAFVLLVTPVLSLILFG